MKLNRIYLVLAAALIGAGAGMAAGAAAPATAAAAPSAHQGHWRHRGSPMVGTLLRATRQLNLTADQQQSIKTLLAAARSQRHAGVNADVTVLGNPGHPDYATAVQSAKSAATSRIEAEVALQGQIYDVLTTEQRQQLPQVLAAMQAKFQARKSAWQQHAAGAVAAGGG